jgi:hypothetical protein
MILVHRKLFEVLSLCAAVAVPGLASAVGISGQGTWETTLQARDLDGNSATAEAYFDTQLGITWLADARYAMTTGFDVDGYMNWNASSTWVAGLDPYASGITGWRLPNTVDVGNDGCSFTNYYQGVDCGYNITTHSELSHMFFVTLGNSAFYDTSGVGDFNQPGWGLTGTADFSIADFVNYWSATEYGTGEAWYFNTGYGFQDYSAKTDVGFAWAVHDGDVGATVVPLPAAAWLFGSGLFGLVTLARKKNA